ncbi:hypothetical protein K27_21900, partial [Klebsiella pneumoniae]
RTEHRIHRPGRRQSIPTIALDLRAQLAQQLHGGIDVFQLRYVLDLYRLFGKQRGKEDWQGGVFAPEMVTSP